MPRREHDTCGKTPEAKEETHEQKKNEDYHPQKRRKRHTQVWGTALYCMKGCWPRSHDCFFIASMISISLRISSAIFFIISMARYFSTQAFIICSTAVLRTLTTAGCLMRSVANSYFCSMTRACSIFIEELLFSCSFFQPMFSSFSRSSSWQSFALSS